MNADQLWDTTMNPDTRLLIRVTIDDAAQSERRLTTLMGTKVEPRRKWIEENVQFTMDEEDTLLAENESVHAKIDEKVEDKLTDQADNEDNNGDVLDNISLFDEEEDA